MVFRRSEDWNLRQKEFARQLADTLDVARQEWEKQLNRLLDIPEPAQPKLMCQELDPSESPTLWLSAPELTAWILGIAVGIITTLLFIRHRRSSAPPTTNGP